MKDFAKRLARLEARRPRGIEQLTDAELDARIRAIRLALISDPDTPPEEQRAYQADLG